MGSVRPVHVLVSETRHARCTANISELYPAAFSNRVTPTRSNSNVFPPTCPASRPLAPSPRPRPCRCSRFPPSSSTDRSLSSNSQAAFLVAQQILTAEDARSPTSHRPTSKLEKTFVPHAAATYCSTRSSVWTPQGFERILGCI